MILSYEEKIEILYIEKIHIHIRPNRMNTVRLIICKEDGSPIILNLTSSIFRY
jgi:hypothetical protein